MTLVVLELLGGREIDCVIGTPLIFLDLSFLEFIHEGSSIGQNQTATAFFPLCGHLENGKGITRYIEPPLPLIMTFLHFPNCRSKWYPLLGQGDLADLLQTGQGRSPAPACVDFMHASRRRKKLCHSDENSSHRPKQRAQQMDRTLIRGPLYVALSFQNIFV